MFNEMGVNLGTSIVDSMQRFEWEVSKEEFDSCEFGIGGNSSKFITSVGSVKIGWKMILFPKGTNEPGLSGLPDDRNEVVIALGSEPLEDCYTVQWGVALKTQSGYWPNDLVEDLYGNKGNGTFSEKKVLGGNGSSFEDRTSFINLGPIEKIREKFTQNKITIVATLVIYVEGKDYLHHKEMARNFAANIRSISDLDML